MTLDMLKSIFGESIIQEQLRKNNINPHIDLNEVSNKISEGEVSIIMVKEIL